MYPPSTSTRSTTDDEPGVGRRLGEGGGLLRSAESAVPANPRSGPGDGFAVRTSVNSWVSSSKASSAALEADAFSTCECLSTVNHNKELGYFYLRKTISAPPSFYRLSHTNVAVNIRGVLLLEYKITSLFLEVD